MSGESVYTAAEILQIFKCRKIDEFLPPSEADIENMQKLLRTIKKYDDRGISVTDKVGLLGADDHKPKIKARIEKLLAKLDMTMSKISDPGYERVMCFHPKEQGGSHIGFFWCFDEVGGNESDSKLVIVDPHRGVDGASGAALREFEALLQVNMVKAYAFNTVHVKASAKNDPPFKHSTTQPKRLMSDGAHSKDTLLNPWAHEVLNNLYPQAGLHVVHGLAAVDRETGEKRLTELWGIPAWGRPSTTKKKSLSALFALALVTTLPEDFAYGSVSVGCVFPNKYIIDNEGHKRFLVSRDIRQSNYDGSTVFTYLRGPSTDTVMHVVNAADGAFLYDAPVERGMHGEHGVPYRDNTEESPENLAKQAHLYATWQVLGKMWNLWDDRVHAEVRFDKKSRARPMIGEPSPDDARLYFDWFMRQRALLENQEQLRTSMPTMLFSVAHRYSDGEEEDLVVDQVSDSEVKDTDTPRRRKKPRMFAAG